MKSLKKFMETQLEDHDLTPGVIPMDLVLFQDAIEHGTLENTSLYAYSDSHLTQTERQSLRTAPVHDGRQ